MLEKQTGEISVPDLLELIRFDFQNAHSGDFPEAEAVRFWGNQFDTFIKNHRLDLCDKILEIAKRYASSLCESCQARIKLAEGELYHYQGNWDKAKQCYVKSLELRYALARREANLSLLAVRRSAIAQSLYHLGKLSFDRGEFRQAERRYLQALHRVQGPTISERLDEYLTGLAEVCRVQGKYMLAKRRLEEAKSFAEKKLRETIESASKRDIEDRLAMILHSLGLISFQLGNFAEAERYFQDGLNFIQNTGNRVLLATVKHQLGAVYQNMGQTEIALKRYEETIEIAEGLRDETKRASGSPHSKADAESLRLIAASRHQLGIIYQSQGKYTEANAQYNEALVTWQGELQNRLGESQTRHQLGVLYHDLRRNAKTQELRKQHEAMAHEHYEAALKIERESGDSAGEAWTLYQLGMLYQDQGDYVRSRENYHGSIAVAQRIGDKATQARGLHQLGITLQNEKNYSDAFQLYENALVFWRESDDRLGEAQTLYQMGLVCQAQNEHSRAEEWYTKALSIERDFKNQPGIALTLLNLGMNHQAQRHYDDALQMYKEALNIVTDLNDQDRVHRLLWQLATVYEQQGEYSKAVELITKVIASSPPDSPLYDETGKYLEHLKSRMLK